MAEVAGQKKMVKMSSRIYAWTLTRLEMAATVLPGLDVAF